MNTTYFTNLVAGNLFRSKTSPAIPTSYYIGLSTTAPNASGTNVSEPSGSYGYARVKLSNLSAPSSGVVSNSNSISFNESTHSWGTVNYFVVYDAVSGGNLLMYGQLSPARSVEEGTIMTIKDGNLKLSVLNG